MAIPYSAEKDDLFGLRGRSSQPGMSDPSRETAADQPGNHSNADPRAEDDAEGGGPCANRGASHCRALCLATLSSRCRGATHFRGRLAAAA